MAKEKQPKPAARNERKKQFDYEKGHWINLETSEIYEWPEAERTQKRSTLLKQTANVYLKYAKKQKEGDAVVSQQEIVKELKGRCTTQAELDKLLKEIRAALRAQSKKLPPLRKKRPEKSKTYAVTVEDLELSDLLLDVQPRDK